MGPPKVMMELPDYNFYEFKESLGIFIYETKFERKVGLKQLVAQMAG